MTRPLRIEFPGAVYHIFTRGNEKRAIFFTKEDRKNFLHTLSNTVERYKWICHTYCLMENHYHLIIETPDGNLSKGMRHLNGVYTQSFNRKHDRVGHLFQGRYKAIIVEKETYLLSLIRYIILNPVRKGYVELPEDWEWSSHRAVVGLERKPPFLTTDWILSQFGGNRAEAIKRYREFVLDGIDEPFPFDKLLKGDIVLGSKAFLKKVSSFLDKNKKLKEIPSKQRNVTRPSLRELFLKEKLENENSKERIFYEAYAVYGYTMKEIADFLGIHYVTVSRAVKKAETKNAEMHASTRRFRTNVIM
ncbi:MAG: transposase [Candidatus Aminicenantales bacterium]